MATAISHPDVLRRLLLEVIRQLRVRVRHQLEFGAGDALGRICARLAVAGSSRLRSIFPTSSAMFWSFTESRSHRE